MRKILQFTLLLGLAACTQAALAFDHTHATWNKLLRTHVTWVSDGHASRVDYSGLQIERNDLANYLDDLSTVSRQEYNSWTKQQQLAFLVNAYNAFTVELLLTRYPDLESIKELGSLFSSPWKKRFLTLLGKKRSLDDIEHRMIREPGVFDEPRIHVAVVCASIGCPALHDEAFTAEQLDKQLEDSLVRFLSDRSRNRYKTNQENWRSRIYSTGTGRTLNRTMENSTPWKSHSPTMPICLQTTSRAEKISGSKMYRSCFLTTIGD
ncbi:DUF547 domain-containing protein [Solemya velesiana gill symbiont]|uniref:DUF547 domain-containing protein n=1 Tax=Solemya velesiana gill symbiont TaxID=1918948 RepID=UPI001FE2E17C|nr:DUF547 domain-containing protein [Solemya velesiana gill symbiont]